jgi:hypothetical protein
MPAGHRKKSTGEQQAISLGLKLNVTANLANDLTNLGDVVLEVVVIPALGLTPLRPTRPFELVSPDDYPSLVVQNRKHPPRLLGQQPVVDIYDLAFGIYERILHFRISAEPLTGIACGSFRLTRRGARAAICFLLTSGSPHGYLA